MEYSTFLRSHIEQVVSLSENEFTLAAGFFTPVRVVRKGFLLQAGQRVSSEFLVVSGCIKTSSYDTAGKEYILQFAIENWWVSDYPAYMDKGLGELVVQALEDSVVLEISLERKRQMCELIPKMHVFHGSKALAGYIAAQKRILSLLRNSAKEKYDLLLSLYPGLFQRIPKKTIAAYLGVSRETLSRLEKH